MPDKSCRNGNGGFTMMELMVSVVIVAILAAVAIPLYGAYIRKSRITEATSHIGEIATSARFYAQANRDETDIPVWPAGAGGLVELGPTENFAYAIVSGGGANALRTALVIQATGQPSSKMAGVQVTVEIPHLNSAASNPRIASPIKK